MEGKSQMARIEHEPTMLSPEYDTETFAKEWNDFCGRFDVHDEVNEISNIHI